MAKQTRYQFKVFGSNANAASEIGQFGSLAAGSPTFTNSITLIQALANWSSGWAAETIATNRPALEDFNAVDYVFAYMIAQIFQDGIAEYEANTTYFTNSIVKVAGQIYISLQDNNTGNTPASSATYWQAGLPSAEITGTIKAYAGTSAPTGYLVCDGSAVSRATYAALFAICGTNYGIGDGSTTFNLPDARTNTLVGYKSGDGTFGTVGQIQGEKTHTLTTPEMPAHTHTKGPAFGVSSILGGNAGADWRIDSAGTEATGSTGGGGAHNNIQPSLTIGCYIIKT